MLTSKEKERLTEAQRQLAQAQAELDAAHRALDDLGVPRVEYAAILPLDGRLRWLEGHCPALPMDVLDARTDIGATERVRLAHDLQYARARREA